MSSVQYINLPTTPFPKGTYIVVHYGRIPPDGFVLSQVKLVFGWPNPVLEWARRGGAPAPWLDFVNDLASGNDRPEFNIGLYQVDGVDFPAAVYGNLEGWPGSSRQQQRFQDRLRLLPSEMQHISHIF